MKYLLDTHVWLWSLLQPERLSDSVREALMDSDAALYLSPISAWEFLVLCDKGHLKVDGDPVDWLTAVLREQPIREAPLDFDVAISSRTLDLRTDDPADRFIAATAMTRGMTLITADSRLLKHPDLETLNA